MMKRYKNGYSIVTRNTIGHCTYGASLEKSPRLPHRMSKSLNFELEPKVAVLKELRIGCRSYLGGPMPSLNMGTASTI